MKQIILAFLCINLLFASNYKEAKEAMKKSDFKKAIKIYTEFAIKGNIDAQANLGALYSMGIGTKIDLKKGLYWTKKAASAGQTDAQVSLGQFYGSPLFYPNYVDYYKAFYWYDKAEEKSVIAQEALSELYRYGRGTLKNENKAFKLIKKAALKTFSAQFTLAEYYCYGIGTKQSLANCSYWAEKAYQKVKSPIIEKLWNKFELWKYKK